MHSNVLMLEEGGWCDPTNTNMMMYRQLARNMPNQQYEDLALPGTSTQTSGVLALPSSESNAMDTSEPVMTVAVPPNMSIVGTQTGGSLFMFCFFCSFCICFFYFACNYLINGFLDF